MENRPGPQDLGAPNQQGGYPPQPNQMQQYQQQPPQMRAPPGQMQMVSPSGVGMVTKDMQNMQISQPPQYPVGSFPGGEHGMPYTRQQNQPIHTAQNHPPQGQMPTMHLGQQGQQQQQTFAPSQPNMHGMTGHSGGPMSSAPSLPGQPYPQNYPVGQGPGMQGGYPPEMGLQSLSPPPAPPPGSTLGMMSFNGGQTPASAPQGQPPQSNWQQGPHASNVQSTHQVSQGPPQGMVHSSAPLQPPPYQPPSQPPSNNIQPDIAPETPSSVCGIDPPESTRDGGMSHQMGVMGSQGYSSFPNQAGNQGHMYNPGHGMMRNHPVDQPGTPPPPSPAPPQSGSQPRPQSHQPQMPHQASNPSGQAFPSPSPSPNPNGENGLGQHQGRYALIQQPNYGPPQMTVSMQNSGYGGQPQGGEQMQQGGYQWIQEPSGQTFSQQGPGNEVGLHQGMDGDSGYGSFHGQTGGHGQEEHSHMPNQNQPPMFGQGSVNQGVGNQGPRMDRVPSEGREENGPSMEDEEEDLDKVASRITMQLMGMSKPNQEAFLGKVFDKIGHENVLEAMIEAFGIERVKMAATALSGV